MHLMASIPIPILAFIAMVGLTGCRGEPDAAVTVYASVDSQCAQHVLGAFTEQTGVSVELHTESVQERSVALFKRAVAETSKVQADVFWAEDPVRAEQLVGWGVVEPYHARGSSRVPASFKHETGAWVGFSSNSRVFLVNAEQVQRRQTPGSIWDMLDPRWKGRVAIAHPAYGSTSVHMGTLFWLWGSQKTRALMEAWRANGVRVVASNDKVVDLVQRGEVAWGIVDTAQAMPYFKPNATLRVAFPDQNEMGTVMLPMAAMVMRNAPHPVAARQVVDFLTHPKTEEILAQPPCHHMPLLVSQAGPEHMPALWSFRSLSLKYDEIAVVLKEIETFLGDWGDGMLKVEPPRIAEAGIVEDPKLGSVLGEPVVLGGVDQGQVKAVLRKKAKSFQQCFLSQFPGEEKKKKSVLLRFVISPAGTAYDFRFRGDASQQDVLERCITTEIASDLFPEPEFGESIVVVVPMSFEKGEG